MFLKILAIGIFLFSLYTLSQDLTKAKYAALLTPNFSKDFNNNSFDLAVISLKPKLSEMINASQKISTIHTPYILENKDICTKVKNLSVLVIIHTSADHFERRLLIRSTWTNNWYFPDLGTVRVLFLLGKADSKKKQKQIEIEFNKYKDILQGDFSDTYRNLTLKGVMAYRWITERCRNAKLILKTDDDVVVNMFKFFSNVFPNYVNKTRQIVCAYRPAGTSEIFRNNENKWTVSTDHFRGLRMYPTTYCRGLMVVFTSDLIPVLYSSSKLTPFFWVDDVYLYGLVPGNVLGVQYNHPEGLDLDIALEPGWALKCLRKQTAVFHNLVFGAETRPEFEEIWFHIVKQHAFVTS